MPIYEYRCRACGHVFETIVSLRAGAEAPACPECDAPDAEKLPSVFASWGSATGGCGGGGFT